MSKRAGPPLFELLRERGQSAADRPAPVKETEAGIPWSTAGVTRAERSAATFEDEPVQTGEIRLSSTKLYLGIAVALALVVVAWVAGYRIGFGAGKAELTPLVRDEAIVTPPREAGSTPTADPVRQPTGGSPSQQSQPQVQPQTPRPGALPANWVLHADGVRAADPRVPGSNYLELATLSADQAGDAIGYLASRGVRAIGVPVDSGGGSANNPARYTLYSLGLAVPSGQYSSTGSERRDHERLISSIGADWMRDRRGGSNFSQTLWRKYDP
jgi:hypothetical protein